MRRMIEMDTINGIEIPTYGNIPCALADIERARSYVSVYKMPVTAWIITKHYKSNNREFFIDCESIVVDGGEQDGVVSVTPDDFEIETTEVLSVIPARSGTYRVYGVRNDNKGDEILGHIIPE
jgi:hypothetical protein